MNGLEPVLDVLERARGLGFLGPGPVADHVDHSRGFAQAWPGAPPALVADLGSGGGIPSLVLAWTWPESRWLLIEANLRRSSFLRDALNDLALADRVTVVTERAEAFARSEHRATCDLVTARSFGAPPTTAECAAPLLRLGGYLIVSEPPTGDADLRWPSAGVAIVGLGPAEVVVAGGRRYARLQLLDAVDLRFPRRVGVPARRPLF